MRTWAVALRTRFAHQLGGWSQKTIFRLQSQLGDTMGKTPQTLQHPRLGE